MIISTFWAYTSARCFITAKWALTTTTSAAHHYGHAKCVFIRGRNDKKILPPFFKGLCSALPPALFSFEILLAAAAMAFMQAGKERSSTRRLNPSWLLCVAPSNQPRHASLKMKEEKITCRTIGGRGLGDSFLSLFLHREDHFTHT